MSEGSGSIPLLMVLLSGTQVLVKYSANLVSYFDPEFSHFWGTKFLLLPQGTQALPH
jgi:hypothetical protein